MEHRTKIMTRLATVAGMALSVAPVNAAVIIMSVTSGPNNPSTPTDELAYVSDVSSTDLLHGITGITSGTAFAGGDAANLNDGLHGINDSTPPLPLGDAVAEVAWTADSGSSREFVIGDGAYGLGYDISGIQSIAAWNDAGFMNQKYNIFLRSLGGSYGLYATVDYQPALAVGEGGATKVNVTDNTGLLGSGIDAIRFDFLDTVSNDVGGAVYREIDVFGVATVPEPSSTVLLSLGGLAIALRRRRA